MAATITASAAHASGSIARAGVIRRTSVPRAVIRRRSHRSTLPALVGSTAARQAGQRAVCQKRAGSIRTQCVPPPQRTITSPRGPLRPPIHPPPCRCRTTRIILPYRRATPPGHPSRRMPCQPSPCRSSPRGTGCRTRSSSTTWRNGATRAAR